MEKRIIKIEVIKAVLLLFLPLILILLTGEIRTSISNYAYSEYANVFVALLTVGSCLFIYNGVINRQKWYNILLGLSLFGVAITPHLEYSFFHYTLATIFFGGSVITMVTYSSAAQRELKIVLGTIICLAIAGHFITEMYSLLIAEWIGMLPISLHFIFESLRKFD